MAEGGGAAEGSERLIWTRQRERNQQSGEDRSPTRRYELRPRSQPRHDEPNPARLFVPDVGTYRDSARSHGENAKKRQRTKGSPKRYETTAGRDGRRHFPIKKKSMHGKGICFLIVNHEHQIPGVSKDVKDLESFYGETLHYTVCGGLHDPEQDHYRDIDRAEYRDIGTRLNKQYDVNYRIRGAEYDRIFIHFFSVGDRDTMWMSDDTVESKLDLLKDIDRSIPNTQQHIPVAVFYHSHPLRPLTANETADISPPGTQINSLNMLGVFSVTQPILGHDQLQRGSWIIQELVVKLHFYHHQLHLCDILHNVSEDASRHQHPRLIGIQKSFKDLFLTMTGTFF